MTLIIKNLIQDAMRNNFTIISLSVLLLCGMMISTASTYANRDDFPFIVNGHGLKKELIVTRNIRRVGGILWQEDVERERKAKEKSLKYQRTA